jgi:hypothetical protein
MDMVERVYLALSDAAIPNKNGDRRSVRYYASVGIDAFNHDPPGSNDLTEARPYFVDKLLWKAAEDIVAAITASSPPSIEAPEPRI